MVSNIHRPQPPWTINSSNTKSDLSSNNNNSIPTTTFHRPIVKSERPAMVAGVAEVVEVSQTLTTTTNDNTHANDANFLQITRALSSITAKRSTARR